ncbi:pyridoxal phosphate-dependent aminotransferase [Thiospirochaeta perfilievii]|uniref:alanine transaminase n=1 Tax=Thiospirochaeta perfilievii TaxID=252967 RepID=A0A5C1QHA0_9SPIO|nr:pyridoxal phosphate-dependent aminotransferase [Thiospirochaeta perfilievii]QEN05946.1 pyridoxal phosphate-dependent aminotransferase [Thiospirochaeta perfilievii]
MYKITKSNKLKNVCYDIRGPIFDEAKKLEEEGYRLIKLNIGNPAPFGFQTPEEISRDIIRNFSDADGYSMSNGLFSARKAVMHECQKKSIKNVDVEDIFIGNGVSELIGISMQALLNDGDEILIPSPDYPLWTASATLAGGKAIHYRCDEENYWYPNLEDIESKVTKTTKAIVVINPNNPTGSLYPVEILEGIIDIARRHSLIIFSDEIYDKILYSGEHVSIASLADDLFFVTFNGLSKSYRAAGYRAGWMILSGEKSQAKDYIEGISMLSNMRLCANVPGQLGIQTALGGFQSIYELTKKGGRLYEQMNYCYNRLINIPGITCTKPQGALYCFPKIDTQMYQIDDDSQFIKELLIETKVLLVQGSGFNVDTPDHFRIIFLADLELLAEALDRIEGYLRKRRAKNLKESNS